MAGIAEGGFAYSTELRDNLMELDLDWYADNPCVQSKDLESFLEMGMTGAQLKLYLDKEKGKIETKFKRYCLESGPTEPRVNQRSPELRCLILGKVGTGKSSLGNLLTGKEKFSVYRTATSGTQTIQYVSSEEFNVKVIDTPGFGSSDGKDHDLEIAKIFNFFRGGIHAFLYVFDMSNPRLSEEDYAIFNKIKEIFGDRMLEHTFLVFTKAGAFFTDEKLCLQDHLEKLYASRLEGSIKTIGKRIIAVDNTSQGYQRRLMQQAILDLMAQSVQEASEPVYTDENFQQSHSDMLEEREKERVKKTKQMASLFKEVDELAAKKLANAKELSDVIAMIGPSDHTMAVIEGASGEVSTSIDGMRESERTELVSSTLHNSLKEHGKKEVMKRMEEIIREMEIDATNLRTEDVYFRQIQRMHRSAVGIVGDEFIRASIRNKMREVQGNQKEQRKAEKIKQFILEHLHLHGNASEIQRCMALSDSDFGGDKSFELINDCLELPDVRGEIHSYREAEAEWQRNNLEIKRRRAFESAVNSAYERVAVVICDKKRSELEKILSDVYLKAGHISVMTREAKGRLGVDLLQVLGQDEIEEIITEIFTKTLENVTNASFGDKWYMFFSCFRSGDYVKELMRPFIHKKDSE